MNKLVVAVTLTLAAFWIAAFWVAPPSAHAIVGPKVAVLGTVADFDQQYVQLVLENGAKIRVSRKDLDPSQEVRPGALIYVLVFLSDLDHPIEPVAAKKVISSARPKLYR